MLIIAGISHIEYLPKNVMNQLNMMSLDKHFAKVVYYRVHSAILRKSTRNVPED
jgi:hypothetical protein